jgi:hypothetical protein
MLHAWQRRDQSHFRLYTRRHTNSAATHKKKITRRTLSLLLFTPLDSHHDESKARARKESESKSNDKSKSKNESKGESESNG